MPRIQIRKAAKAAAKKTSKKVAKKVTKKPAKKVGKTKVYTSTLSVEESPKETPEQSTGRPEEATQDAYAEAGNVNTHNALLLQVPNPVVAARARVLRAVQHLIDAAIDSYTARSEEEPVRAYLRSVQESAAREFDMALHLLETEIRR